MAPGTRYFRYRCFLPDLAGFTAVASPGTINVTQVEAEPEGAEGEGFEPSVPFSTHDFQSCTFGHSVIPPKRARAVARRSLARWSVGIVLSVEIADREGFEPPVLSHI